MGNWVIPCNAKKYDHARAFQNLPEIDWRQSTGVCAGDLVYIYVGKPISAIKYKCLVVKADMAAHTIDDSQYVLVDDLGMKAKKYMRLRLLEIYSDDKYPRLELLNNGLGTIQGPCRVNDELDSYLR